MKKVRKINFPVSRKSEPPGWLLETAHQRAIQPAYSLLSDDDLACDNEESSSRPFRTDNSRSNAHSAERVLQEEIEALRQQAIDEGRQQGVELGRAQFDADALRLREMASLLESAKQQVIDKVEEQVVDLAITIAETIVARELVMDRDYVMRLLREALPMLAKSERVTIKFGPRDRELLEASMQELKQRTPQFSDIRLELDESIAGGCVVETEIARVDATIASRLRTVADTLMQDSE